MQNSAANIAHVHTQLLQSHLAKQLSVPYLLVPWGCCQFLGDAADLSLTH